MLKYKYKGDGNQKIIRDLNKYDLSTLKIFYFEMLRIRLIEETIASRYHEDQMKTPIHLVIGQEATAVGACQALKITDHVYCGHRTHGCYLAKGGNLQTMLAEFFCKSTGCCGSRGGSMHLLDKEVGMMGSSAIVAGIIPIATGSALAAQMQSLDRLTLVFLGDAAVEEGSAWESINFSVLKRLPIIYLCENNYYSVCSPLSKRQPEQVAIYQKAAGFGAKSYSIDGNNVLEVYDTVKQAINDVQQGPVFIEAHTYRYRGHHGAAEDGEAGYRTQNEIEHWKDHDPISLFHHAMTEQNLIHLEEIKVWRAQIQNEIDLAFQYAEQSSKPTEHDLMQHVYS